MKKSSIPLLCSQMPRIEPPGLGYSFSIRKLQGVGINQQSGESGDRVGLRG
jgi:hypothetical protein